MNLILIEKPKESSLSKPQQTFNRLVKKLEMFQKFLEQTQLEVNEAFHYYCNHLRPLEHKINLKLAECVKLFYAFEKNPSKLSKKERILLRDLINTTISRLCSFQTPNDIDPEIQRIIEELEGVNFKEKQIQELSNIKNEILKEAAENGLPIDLSEISASDSQEEMLIKLMSAFSEAKRNQKEREPAKKKTKRQLEKERKIQELADIQKKGLSTIYKQLAKALHPDLEPDPTVKVEKEALMKKLTTAYEQNNLHGLLSLEIEWMNHPRHGGKGDRTLPDEQLKVYNAILKDQVDELKAELERVSSHPRYFEMQYLLKEHVGTSPKNALYLSENELKGQLHLFSSTAADLKGDSPLKALQAILKSYAREIEMENLFSDLITLT